MSDVASRSVWPERLRTAGAAAIGGGLALASYSLSGSLPVSIAVLLGASAAAAALCEAFGSRDALNELQAGIRALASGDTSRRLDAARMGPLAAEAEALNELAANLAASTRRVIELTDRLGALPEEVAGALMEIEGGADKQEASVEETASLIANINTSIRGINGEVEGLARANEEAASSVLEMGTAVEQVARSASLLQESVESSTTAVHEMGAQIHRVAESSDSVKGVAEETAAAISEMDHSIQEVGEHVRSASELTERVSQSADEGSQAVGKTIEGIAAIRSLTLGARKALGGLDERIGEIGEIASVIGGISDETNLLSLNAAIIAAQAGEHGRAFAVVADQVKTLARRTTESAKQIGDLIQAVQGESKNAVVAMGKGIESVEEGVDRSRRAGGALEAIRTSARDASGRVAEIARAAEEQARNSRHVAQAARQTSEHVQQISSAMTEQATASERMLENATQALEMCRQMTTATEEQRSSGRYIQANIAAITEMIRSIQQNTASHAQASEAVSRTVSSILDEARKSAEHIPEVARAVDALRSHSMAVRKEITRFDVSAGRF